MIQESALSPVSVRRAVQRALSGTTSDAESAGRLLLGASMETAGSVLTEVEAVLLAADPRFWIALETARASLYWKAAGKSFREPLSTDTVPALCVKAVFADGRFRERAVRHLAGTGSLAALPILALRAADWVPQVRQAARDAISGRLARDRDGNALAAVAPMTLLLARRSQGLWLADEVTRRLADASSRQLVTRLLDSSNLGLRRAAYQVVIEGGTLELERAVYAAVHDSDIMIRNRCAEHAKHLATDPQSTALICEMLASRTPMVRAEAVLALDSLGELDMIQAALPDRSSLVRGTARFCLRPHGIDVGAIYRQLVSGDPEAVTAGAVAGLGEAGTSADAALITSLLDHPLVKVRVEAIRALQSLAAEIDSDQMLAMIEEDSSSAVTRQAGAAILTRGAGIDPDRLLALMAPTRPTRVRLAARQLLASRSTVWRLAVNVMLLDEADENLALRARADLDSAMQQQIYAKPSGQAAELLAAHLVNADRLLTPADARFLRIILDMPQPAETDDPKGARV